MTGHEEGQRDEPLATQLDEQLTIGALDRAILGEDRVYTALQVAEETGVSVNDLRRLWRSLGFPEHPTSVAFTNADVRAVSLISGLLESGLIDFDLAVNLTRALGRTISRLADWEVATLVGRVEELESGDRASGSRMVTAARMVAQINKPFEELLIYAWRRHLADAAARTEALRASHEDLHTTQVTVGFADIVGFTALSNEVDTQRIGDLVEIFETRCSDVISGKRGRIIKSIGDSVLFVNEDPVAGLETAEGIVAVIGRDSRMPDVRLGLATGSVVTRMGDVFGPPVNLAARLTSVARRNRIIVDQHTADQLPSEQFETRALPPRPVRGFGLVEPLSVRRV